MRVTRVPHLGAGVFEDRFELSRAHTWEHLDDAMFVGVTAVHDVWGSRTRSMGSTCGNGHVTGRA
jgi:hypothetical protein